MTRSEIVILVNEKLTDGGTQPRILSDMQIEEIVSRVAMRFTRMSNGWNPTEEDLYNAPLIQASIVEECERRIAWLEERYAFGM